MRAFSLFVLALLLVSPCATFASDKVALDTSSCRTLSAYLPSDDVTYKEGVDVHGQPVAPADLAGDSSQQLGRQLLAATSIPITVDVAQFLGLPLPAVTGLETKAVVGVLEFSSTGELLLNGEPLTNLQKSKLTALCK
jgi:hypothetical protein